MTVAQQKDLRTRVLEIVKDSDEALSLPTIEVKLKAADWWGANTFDVRDVVAELVEERQLEFVPGRLVRPVRK